MPESLSDIVLEEISFVDNPANQEANILLFKRSASDVQPKEAKMADKMTPEQEARMKAYMDKGYGKDKAREMAMTKSAEGLIEEIETLTATNEDLTKSFDEASEKLMNIEMALEKAGITLTEEGSIEKSADPEYVEVDGERVEKSAIPAPLLKRMEADSQRIAALEKRDNEVKLAKRAKDELPNLAGTDLQKGQLLEAVEKTDGSEDLLRALKAADAAVAKMFEEVGKGQDDTDDTGPSATLEKMVSDYASENKVPRESAFVEVTRKGEGRELYKQVRSERSN